jgi:hypothetical protein
MAKLTTRTALLDPGCECGWELTKVASTLPEGATVLVYKVAGVPKEGNFTHPKGNRGWVTGLGWNGSYHDCRYEPYILAWAKGPAALRRARKMGREAKASLVTMDTAIARFNARAQVRSGD